MIDSETIKNELSAQREDDYKCKDVSCCDIIHREHWKKV